jgi:putative copper export protein
MLLALRVVMRTAHLVAAAAWLGGSIFYLVVLLPSLRLGGPAPAVAARAAALFRQLVNVCLGVLLVTGVYLIVDRLSSQEVGAGYLVVLVCKVVVALVLVALALYQAQEGALQLRAGHGALWKAAPRLILALGLLAFLLGALLTGLFEVSAVPA